MEPKQLFFLKQKRASEKNPSNAAKKAKFDPKTINTWHGYPAGSVPKAVLSAIKALVADSDSAEVASNFAELGLLCFKLINLPQPVIAYTSAIQVSVPSIHQSAHCHSQYNILLYNL